LLELESFVPNENIPPLDDCPVVPPPVEKLPRELLPIDPDDTVDELLNGDGLEVVAVVNGKFEEELLLDGLPNKEELFEVLRVESNCELPKERLL